MAVSLQRTYQNVPAIELKRQARAGDEIAALLYRAASYGHSMRAVLWFVIAVTSATFFVYVSRTEPIWFALASSAALIWLGFVWLPARQVSRYSRWIAARVAPALSWILYYLHPIIDVLHRFIRKHVPVTIHTGLYEKEDLIDLLERQRVQPDNRIEQTELEIALNALTIGDKDVSSALTPRRIVKMVSIKDAIGPILMSELHGSGFSRFPIYDGNKDNIVGTLYLRDIVNAKEGGLVKDLMRAEVFYIHEEQSLVEALQAILKTKRHLFVVVNNFEEFVGILTIEDVLERIVGKPIVDEFDQYEDLRAVARKQARQEHHEHERKTPSEVSEVVE